MSRSFPRIVAVLLIPNLVLSNVDGLALNPAHSVPHQLQFEAEALVERAVWVDPVRSRPVSPKIQGEVGAIASDDFRARSALKFYRKTPLLQNYQSMSLPNTLVWLERNLSKLGPYSLGYLVLALGAAGRLPLGVSLEKWERSAIAYDFYRGSSLLQGYEPEDLNATLQWLSDHRSELGNNSLGYLVLALGMAGRLPRRASLQKWERSAIAYDFYRGSSLLQGYEPQNLEGTLRWLNEHRAELGNNSLSYLIQALAVSGRISPDEDLVTWQRTAGAYDFYRASSLLHGYKPQDLEGTLRWLNEHREELGNNSLSYLIQALRTAGRLPLEANPEKWQRSAGAYDFYLGSPLLQGYESKDLTATLRWLSEHRSELGNNSLGHLVVALSVAGRLPAPPSLPGWVWEAATFDRAIKDELIISKEIRRIWSTGARRSYQSDLERLLMDFDPNMLASRKTGKPLSNGYRKMLLKHAFELYGQRLIKELMAPLTTAPSSAKVSEDKPAKKPPEIIGNAWNSELVYDGKLHNPMMREEDFSGFRPKMGAYAVKNDKEVPGGIAPPAPEPWRPDREVIEIIRELQAQPLRHLDSGAFHNVFASDHWVAKAPVISDRRRMSIVIVHEAKLRVMRLLGEKTPPFIVGEVNGADPGLPTRIRAVFIKASRQIVFAALSILPRSVWERWSPWQEWAGDLAKWHANGERVAAKRLSHTHGGIPRQVLIPATEVRLDQWPWQMTVTTVDQRVDRNLLVDLRNTTIEQLARKMHQFGELQIWLWSHGVFMSDLIFSNFGVLGTSQLLLDKGGVTEDPLTIRRNLQISTLKQLAEMRDQLLAIFPDFPRIVDETLAPLANLLTESQVRSYWPTPDEPGWTMPLSIKSTAPAIKPPEIIGNAWNSELMYDGKLHNPMMREENFSSFRPRFGAYAIKEDKNLYPSAVMDVPKFSRMMGDLLQSMGKVSSAHNHLTFEDFYRTSVALYRDVSILLLVVQPNAVIDEADWWGAVLLGLRTQLAATKESVVQLGVIWNIACRHIFKSLAVPYKLPGTALRKLLDNFRSSPFYATDRDQVTDEAGLLDWLRVRHPRRLSILQQTLRVSFPQSLAADNAVPEVSRAYKNEIENRFIQHDLRKAVSGVLRGLTPKEEKVIEYRFGMDGSDDEFLRTIGNMLALTPERVRQIEAKALRKLRHPSRSALLRNLWINLGDVISRTVRRLASDLWEGGLERPFADMAASALVRANWKVWDELLRYGLLSWSDRDALYYPDSHHRIDATRLLQALRSIENLTFKNNADILKAMIDYGKSQVKATSESVEAKQPDINKTIYGLKLYSHARNVLVNNNIIQIAQLTRLRREQVLSLKGAGKKTIRQIQNALEERGESLYTDPHLREIESLLILFSDHARLFSQGIETFEQLRQALHKPDFIADSQMVRIRDALNKFDKDQILDNTMALPVIADYDMDRATLRVKGFDITVFKKVFIGQTGLVALRVLVDRLYGNRGGNPREIYITRPSEETAMIVAADLVNLICDSSISDINAVIRKFVETQRLAARKTFHRAA